MTRGPIPRFDLYEELEVSRLASAEVIEAAYRTLVKRHHPDVSAGADGAGDIDAERIKRLNVAHGWLTSPTLRARYDETTEAMPRPEVAKKVPAADEPQQDLAPGGFGPNSPEVRQFLADLRPLDEARGLEMRAGKATLGTTQYAEARGAAMAASRTGGRHDQWLFARDAAMVIARGKLDDPALVAEIAAIVADVAGAIVVRDRIPLTDYQTLLTPWTWRPEVAPPTTVRVAAGSVVRSSRRPIAAGVGATVLVAAIGLAVLGGAFAGPRPSPSTLTAAATGTPRPLTGLASPLASVPVVVATPLATFDPSTPQPVPTLEPTIGPGPTSPSAPNATPRATPRPTPVQGPVPTPSPTPVPTSVPTPVPTPSPTPRVICTVPQLVGQNSANILALWTGAFFTGTITYAPVTPPQYFVAWQSLTAGTDVLCTSDITVQKVAP